MPISKPVALGIVVAVVMFAVLVLGFEGYIPALNTFFHGGSLQTSRVMTYSMAPTIMSGALVSYDTSVSFGSLTIGDIILFHVENSSNIWVSRVIHVYPGAVSTQGDGNPAPEGFNVTSSMYVGKVVRIQNP